MIVFITICLFLGIAMMTQFPLPSENEGYSAELIFCWLILSCVAAIPVSLIWELVTIVIHVIGFM